jgi:hypothetical protein
MEQGGAGNSGEQRHAQAGARDSDSSSVAKTGGTNLAHSEARQGLNGSSNRLELGAKALP